MAKKMPASVKKAFKTGKAGKGSAKTRATKAAKTQASKGLTPAQKRKLPPALQRAILAKKRGAKKK